MTATEWTSERLSFLEKELERAEFVLARAELIGDCFTRRGGGGLEQRLLDAGIDALTADELVRGASVFGYRDNRPRLRKTVRVLRARIAALRVA